MHIPGLIFKEIVHRKLNFLFAVLAVISAVAVYSAIMTTGDAYNRETRRIMRDMGRNLRIIPKNASVDEFWANGFTSATMPEEYVQKFASLRGFSYTHLTALLQRKIQWRGKTVILTGILPEVLPADKQQQKPMALNGKVFSVQPGEIYVGFTIAQSLGLHNNDVVEINNHQFKIAQTLSEVGSADDATIYGNLKDVQTVLGPETKGRISEIKALECLCLVARDGKGDTRTMQEMARDQLAQILPEARVFLLGEIAQIRAQQRAATEGYVAFVVPALVIVCGIWIALLFVINVRERTCEVGILRSLGYGTITISELFLGKALIVGLIGAAAGFFVGMPLALHVGPEIFPITAKAIQPQYYLLTRTLWVAPLLAVCASFIPTMIAVTAEPAETLRAD